MDVYFAAMKIELVEQSKEYEVSHFLSKPYDTHIKVY